MNNVLETNRLTLVPFRPEEVALLHQTFTNSFVREYLWDNEIITLEQTEAIIRANQEHFKNEWWGLWKILVKPDQAYAGFAGLWFFFEEKQPQLLYGLLPHKTKQGYATEAARAVLTYAFEQLHFPYLIAACNSPHQASKNVRERLNMKVIAEKQVNNQATTFYRLDAAEGKL